jgi:zinc protease
MKNSSFLMAAVILIISACTPKTGQKVGKTVGNVDKNAEFRKMSPKAGPAPKIQLGNFETFKLDNGLTVILVENHKLPKIAWNLTIDNDPILEKDAAGYTELFGSLLSRGTTTRTKAKFDEEADFIGANLSPRANGLFAESLTRHTDKLLDLGTDAIFNPAFSNEEFEKIKTEALSGLASEKDNADAIAGNVAARLKYGSGHPYGEVQTEETVGKATLELCKSYYSTYFKPNNAYLTVVGDVTRAEAERLSKKYFGTWKRGDVPKNTFATPKSPEKTTVDFVNKPGAVQSVINVTYPIDLRPGTPDVIKSTVMNTLLGGFFNSYLMQNLREKRAYTYGARSALSPDELVGSFNANASVRNAVTDSSLIQFMVELNRIRTEKPSETALLQVKSVVAGNFGRSLEDPSTIARFALNTIRYKLPTDYYATYLEKVAAVTADDVLAMAQKYVRPDRAHIVVVGNQEQVADKLKPFAADGKINLFDVYGNEIKPIEAKIPPGMTAEIVLADYISAIGGKEKVAAVKDFEQFGSANIMGRDVMTHTAKKVGGMILNEMKSGEKLIQKQVSDGKKGQNAGMGGNAPMDENELADIRREAVPFVESQYIALGYKTELKGIELINGKKAYRIDVKLPNNRLIQEFYDMESSLKVREMTTEGDGTEAQTMTTDFADYKDIDGLKIPHTTIVTGMMPTPLKFLVTSVKINSGLADTLFLVK